MKRIIIKWNNYPKQIVKVDSNDVDNWAKQYIGSNGTYIKK